MNRKPIRERDFGDELTFKATRSSGPGGQNVNKVNTQVELRFKPMESEHLNKSEKERLKKRMKNKINADGSIIITSQSERSQIKNKEQCLEKFYDLLEKATKPVKKRKPTSPTRASKEKRLEKKRILSEKKKMRKKIE